MKIVVIGGSGLIGSKLVNKLRQLDHVVVAASPGSGVNTVTGEGLEEVLEGAEVVVDVANSPSFADNDVMEFFRASGQNLLKAEAAAGVGHHVALSIVGADRLPDSGYLRAKLVQESLIRESSIPYSILRSTQFFEFAGGIAQAGTIGEEVHISTGAIQPIASDDVVDALADVVVGKPLNGTTEVAGPVRMPMSQFIGLYLDSKNDPRKLIPDGQARYFGAVLDDQSIVPAGEARLGKIRYEDWLSTQELKMPA